MKIVFGHFDFTGCRDGVLYKKLSRYPAVSDREVQNVLDFTAYETAHGRDCPEKIEETA